LIQIEVFERGGIGAGARQRLHCMSVAADYKIRQTWKAQLIASGYFVKQAPVLLIGELPTVKSDFCEWQLGLRCAQLPLDDGGWLSHELMDYFILRTRNAQHAVVHLFVTVGSNTHCCGDY
jgi:hypothetical protein